MLTAIYVSCVALAVLFALIGLLGVAITLGVIAAVLVARSDVVTWGSLLRPY